MSCLHDHSHFVLDAKRDPTGTTVLRRNYEREIVRRFRRLRALVIEALVKMDVLGLKNSPELSQSFQTALFRTMFRSDAASPPRRSFAFNRSSDKVNSFMEWLYQAQAEEILGVQVGTPVRNAASSSWQNVYIDTAYQKGIRDAGSKLKAGGATVRPSWINGAMNRPVHADRAGLIYTRAFSELEGITDTMSSQISRVLAQGIAEGKHPNAIARDLVNRIDNVGITRARTLARTETISAHAEASLNAYREADVEGVEVEAEFTTAGDDVVCPECEELEGKIFPIGEASGMIPVHPNCRCAFLPIVGNPDIVLE